MSGIFYVVRVKGQKLELTKREAENLFDELRVAFNTPKDMFGVQFEQAGLKDINEITCKGQSC